MKVSQIKPNAIADILGSISSYSQATKGYYQVDNQGVYHILFDTGAMLKLSSKESFDIISANVNLQKK